MPTMTAKQPFRGEKFACQNPVVTEPTSTPVVIQLTHRFSAISPFGADHDKSESKITGLDPLQDLDLPLFPGKCWFGG
jgi:hypothetical protein